MAVVVGLGHARVGVHLELRLLQRGADDGQARLAAQVVVAHLPDGRARVAALLLVEARVGARDVAGERGGGQDAGDEGGGELHGDEMGKFSFVLVREEEEEEKRACLLL